jgi:hypothetical protein
VRHAEDAPDELEHRRVEQGDEPGREHPHVHHQRRGGSGDGTRHVESGGEYTSTGYGRRRRVGHCCRWTAKVIG